MRFLSALTQAETKVSARHCLDRLAQEVRELVELLPDRHVHVVLAVKVDDQAAEDALVDLGRDDQLLA